MRIKDLEKMGLRQKTLDAIEISVSDIISTDEFFRPGPSKDYRKEAIDRLVGLNVDFSSNCNLVYDMMRKFIKVECPYCGGETKVVSGGGDSNCAAMTYRCGKCESGVSLNMFNNGISVMPSEKKKSESK